LLAPGKFRNRTWSIEKIHFFGYASYLTLRVRLSSQTLKEQLLRVRVFQNIEELRGALVEFRERYNQRWIVQRLGYLTPAQARQQLLALGAAA
jgi:transposase InsO family protein